MTFLSSVVIILETMLAEYLFALKFPKRKLFWLRFLGYGVTALVIAFWIQFAYSLFSGNDFVYGAPTDNVGESLFKLFFYCIIFVMTYVVCLLSYDRPTMEIFFCCSAAYAIQHIARNISNLIVLIPIFSNADYGQILETAVTALIYVIVYVLAYFILIKPSNDTHSANNKQKIVISFLVLISCILMSRLTSDNADRNIISILAESIYAILCSILILYVQFALSVNDNMRCEIDGMSELLRSERRQFELSKETIDLINIKCHDIKHQLLALKSKSGIPEDSIFELEQVITIYDSNVKTGNDALDVILTQKKLYCEDKKIQITGIIDGGLINFINDIDIYSLFGNALSNAIESVENILDEQKRCIGVNVTALDGIAVIHVENYFEGDLVFKNGLPQTDGDTDYHGYGMKSMERIAQKYGGEISVFVNDSKFNLDIILPIPEKKR